MMPNLLLIEDNPADAFMAKMMIEERLEDIRIHHVVDGEKAVDFLHQTGDFSDAPRPDLVLVDLNLPGMSGFSVMSEINRNPALKNMPMIVLTTSSEPQDRKEALQLGAREYIVKTPNLNQWNQIVSQFTRVMEQTDEKTPDSA